MKYSATGLLRRALCLLAILAMLAAPASLAEEITADIGDLTELTGPELELAEAPVDEVQDLLIPLDADPEAQAAEPGLNGGGSLVEPVPVLEVNTSEPAEEYTSKSYSFNIGGKSSLSMMIGDTLEIWFPKSNGKTWSSSKSGIVEFSPYSDEDSVLLAAVKAGTTKLTVTLTTGKKYTVTLKVSDPYTLKSMTLRKSSVSLPAGKDFSMADYLKLKPAYAKASFSYKSSKPSVATVSATGIVTGVKAGTANITVTSSKLSRTLKVTVTANNSVQLHAAPKTADAKALGKQWTLWPRYLSLRGDGTLICRLYLLNGSGGKLTTLKNLSLAVSYTSAYGENLMASHTFKTVSVSCAKNSFTTVALTFPASDVYYSGITLSSIGKSRFKFRLYTKPTAKNSSASFAYSPSAIGVTGDPAADNPVTYRALLVSENDFYFSHAPGYSWAWEHITRNKGDVKLMKALLGRVKTPDGGSYSVKVKHNTTHDQLVRLIRSTFAGADDNDVSLFFIATHGDSDDETPASKSGALSMASLTDSYPEAFYLSELRDLLLEVPGKVIVILESCGSGASIYKGNAASAYSAAQAFDSEAVDLFRDADPGVILPAADYAANTGELRKTNKFYVLCCSEYREESYGTENPSTGSYGNNLFTRWLAKGVGKSGSMPADKKYAGNGNGVVDLHELYRYISGVGDQYAVPLKDGTYYQHAQVYPSGVRYALFK